MNPQPEIAIIGAGNVAWHLAKSFDSFAHVRQVMSPTLEHAVAICRQLRNAQPIDSYSLLTTDADYYIIAVSDRAVSEVAACMPPVKGIIAHTAGSVDMEALRPASDQIGVFYPLQTFTKGVNVDMTQVPIFTQGSSKKVLDSLDLLAILTNGNEPNDEAFTRQARLHADSQQRSDLHLAAVFACNFANRLWGIAEKILKRDNYELKILMPLIRATLDKAAAMSPSLAQTGPAVRGDQQVIDRHLSLLSGQDKELYKLITQSIIDNKNSK